MTSGCLDRKEVRDAIWGVHSSGTGQPMETQDVFFWRLASRSTPTGLAIVHWIGLYYLLHQSFTHFTWCHSVVKFFQPTTSELLWIKFWP